MSVKIPNNSSTHENLGNMCNHHNQHMTILRDPKVLTPSEFASKYEISCDLAYIEYIKLLLSPLKPLPIYR